MHNSVAEIREQVLLDHGAEFAEPGLRLAGDEDAARRRPARRDRLDAPARLDIGRRMARDHGAADAGNRPATSLHLRA